MDGEEGRRSNAGCFGWTLGEVALRYNLGGHVAWSSAAFWLVFWPIYTPLTLACTPLPIWVCFSGPHSSHRLRHTAASYRTFSIASISFSPQSTSSCSTRRLPFPSPWHLSFPHRRSWTADGCVLLYATKFHIIQDTNTFQARQHQSGNRLQYPLYRLPRSLAWRIPRMVIGQVPKCTLAYNPSGQAV